jgi:serine/threonine-protein kinase RsbW
MVRDSRIILAVEDQGSGFNYSCFLDDSCRNEDLYELNDIKESGRGILIVKNLCDEIRFNKKGNRIIIVKRIK